MSSVMNYEENILAAIQTIVNDAVDHASYDRTIQATIKKVVDATTGKYRIAYQDSVFYAYATSADITYSVGTNVYVLIPGNDMSKTKTILGTVDNLGADFINILTNEEIYENMGVNIANSTTEFGLNSYVSEQLIKLYDKTEDINLINLNPEDAEMYIKQNDYITLGAYFKTNLSNEQKAKGNYGISFDFIYENELGENEHRICTIDIDSFNGSPYDLYTYIKQTSTYINFDKDKFKYIDSISIFENGFPYVRSGEPNDIFIKDIQIFGARKIPEEELASCMLSILTPQGTYFKTTDEASATKNLKAQIRVKGKIAGEYDETRFYWFRENASVTKNTRSDLYCSFGGSGWECLNLKNTLGNDVYEWVPADENFSVTKADLMLQENKYKCVALYNDDIVLSREITLYNKSAATMTIESSNGQQFYFDMGQTVLTCTLSEELPNLTYTWRNLYDILDDTTENITVQAKDINRYDIYQCTVYSGDNYVGTANIILYNSLDKTENTKIIINNGSQVFKYTVDGIAPNNASIEKPITILPLSFVLFDDDGAEITQEKIAASAIEWLVPAENTMLLIPDGYGIPTQENEWNVYKNLRSLNFNILTRYDANKEHNVIKLRVTLGDRVYTAETNLIFLKEGERGSNGTDFVCKVVPNISGANFINQPVVTVYNNAYSLNYTPAQSNRWFKTQLWHDGELIYEGTEDGNSTENKNVDITWSVLQNSYSHTIKDNSNFTINANTGVINFNTSESKYGSAVIQCKTVYDGIEYYDNIPVIIKFLSNNAYDFDLKENSGFKYAIYESNGHNPKYDNATPFEILVSKNNEDISLLENTTYTWTVLGQYYEQGDWQDIENLIPVTSYIETHNLTKNQKRYKPIDSYDGLCVNNSIMCYIEDNDIEIGTIYIPIDLYINRYGNAALNSWNGNSIQIRNEDGLILSPQIGAGKKESDNTFTGMFMGDVQENATTERETGLFGYYHGERTIELNAENGTAKFGKNGAGQIIMDPTQNRAVIRSGNYSAENNTGLEIDLTDPHIKFGNGSKFQIDNQGNVIATALTIVPSQVSGLSDTISDVEDLKDTINYFEVTLNTYSITIPCSAEDNIPLATATYEIAAAGTFKGQPVTISNITTTDSYTGIDNSVSLANQKITFGVNANRSVANLINSYNYTFTYTVNGITYTTEKQINLVLTQQGKDGEQGPVGPAGKDGTSVTVKGSYSTITELTTAHPSGNTLGDGYVVGLDLYIYTNAAGGSGSLAGDWEDVGQFKAQDAKRCFIVASTEVFKSTDGGVTYAPDNTILTPFFQAVAYTSWAYSTNGGASFITINPNNLPNGISIDNNANLTLLKTSTLFNINSTLVFKCNSNATDVFDTITISKIADGQSSSTAFLTNTNLSFVGAADTGKVAATTITTNVVGYQGTTKTTCSLGTIGGDIPTGMTVTAGNAVDNEIPITVKIAANSTLGGTGSQRGTIIIPIYTPVQTTLYLNWIKLNTGNTGTKGYNTARIYLYQRAASTPANISYTGNLTYTFSTSTLSSVPTGWSQTIPADNGNPLYVSVAVAYANTTTDTITASEWSAPVKYVADGTPGDDAKILNITTAPAQTFTRADSSVAYTPNLIILTPETMNCNPGKWYYNALVDGNWTWTEITSSTASEAAAYKSGNNLCVPSGFTYNNNANSVAFKCAAADNSCSDVISIVRLSGGKDGANGISTTIKNKEISYGYSTNGTDSTSVTNWGSSIPNVPDGQYLWTRTTINYTNNGTTVSDSVTSYSVSYQAVDGEPGTDATQYYTYVRYASSSTPSSSDMSASSTGKTWVGIAVTTATSAPTTYTSYQWSKIVGTNATQYYTYIRYSKNSNGNPMVETPTAETKYIGVCVTTSSTVPAYNNSAWKWSLYAATQYYTHIKYASSSSPSADDMSDSSEGKTYMGVAVTTSSTAPTTASSYTWTKIVGEDGTNGTSYYTYIRYSANSDGSSMVETPTSSTKYVGTYSGTSSTVPAYTAFKWSKYVGENATQYYTYVRYASSTTPASSDISVDSTGKTYVGIAVTTASSAPTTYSSYKWSKIVGADGFSVWTTTTAPSSNKINISALTGPTGITPRVGEHIIQSNRYQYTITAVSSTQVTVGTAVDLKGKDGNNGTSIIWKGNLATAPSNPENLWAYYNTTDKKSYIYNGSAWTTMTIDGTNGTNATQYYYHVVYCNNTSTGAGYSTTASDKLYTGTYVDTNANDASSWSALPSGVKWNYTKGDPGVSATNIVCGNEAQSIVCDKDGKTVAASTITIPFAGYIGSDRAACSVAVSGLPSGMTVNTNTAATASADGVLKLNVNNGTTLGGNSSGEVTLTFTCNSLSFVKKFAWSKAMAGNNGNDAYTVVLSNESHTFPATNTAATASSTTIEVYAYKGTSSVTPTIGTITGQITDKLTASVSGTTITVSATTSLTTQSGVLTIPVTVDGKTFNKKFSWSLAKTGNPGTNGTSPTAYDLKIKDVTVVKKQDNTYSPTSTTFYVSSQTGSGNISTYTAGSYRITKDGGTAGSWTNLTSSISYSFSSNTPSTSVLIEIAKENASSSSHTIIDSQTIAVVKDGTNGTNGTSPYIAYLTNEAQTIAYNVSTSVAAATTDLYAYQGTTEKNVTISKINNTTISTANTYTSVGLSNLQVSVDKLTGAHPKISFKATATLTQGQTIQVPITYTIAGDSTTRTIYFSYSTTTRGATGTAARTYELNASANSIVKKVTDTFSPASITFTSYYRDGQGTSKTAYSGTWWIQSSIDGNTWTDLVAASTTNATSKTVSPSGDMKLIRAYLGPASTTPTAVNALDIMTIPILNDSTDIEIGGRNLVWRSKQLNGTPSSTDRYITAYNNANIVEREDGFFASRITDTSSWRGITFRGESLNLKVNDEIVYSFNVQSSGYSSNLTFYAMIYDSSGTRLQGAYLKLTYKGNSSTYSNIGLDNVTATTDTRYSLNIQWLQAIQDVIDEGGYVNFSIQESSPSKADTDSYLDIYAPKVEKGNVPTDWTPAPEDDQDNLGSVIIQYTTTNNDTPPGSSAQWDISYTAAGTKYIWQRMISYSQSGDLIIESAPSLIYIPTPALVSSITQYYIHTSRSNAPTVTADSSWLTEKPIWTEAYKDKKFLWTRIKSTYTLGDPQYTAPSLDESWETYSALDSSVNSLATSINEAIDNGIVEIKGGAITVYNDAGGYNSATAAVRINEKGIIFMYKENGAWAAETAAWGYDTTSGQWTFNSELINVISLKADNITNGKLTLTGSELTIKESYSTLARLKAAHSTGTVGDAYYVEDEQAVYTWNGSAWEKRDGGEFTLQDKDGKSVCMIDANGLNILCKDGSRFAVKVQEDENNLYNLQIYDSHNSMLAYTDTTNNIWVMTNAKVTTSLQVGLRVKIVPIGNGIGFIAA